MLKYRYIVMPRDGGYTVHMCGHGAFLPVGTFAIEAEANKAKREHEQKEKWLAKLDRDAKKRTK